MKTMRRTHHAAGILVLITVAVLISSLAGCKKEEVPKVIGFPQSFADLAERYGPLSSTSVPSLPSRSRALRSISFSGPKSKSP